MLRYTLDPVEFKKEYAQTLTCGYYDGDRPAANYLEEDMIQEIDYLGLDKDLSFILVQNRSLNLYGFITVKLENYNNRPKGVKIHSIGYVNEDAFHFIINQLKLNLGSELNENGENKYDYIWGYEYADYALLENNFMVDYANNMFISELPRINPNPTIE